MPIKWVTEVPSDNEPIIKAIQSELNSLEVQRRISLNLNERADIDAKIFVLLKRLKELQRE